MPRRNSRRQSYEPLDLTPEDVAVKRTADHRWHDRQQVQIEREKRMARQRHARINKGIDWGVCLVPGCGALLQYWGRNEHGDPRWRDHTVALPLCIEHMFVAANQSRLLDTDAFAEHMLALHERVGAKAAAVEEERKVAHLANTTDGHIYFIRLNGIIKVGWTRDLWMRIKSYGASAEVLCTYPGSRDDETYLHRQLRPVLTKGREWYEDGPIIADFIARAFRDSGAKVPDTSGMWTQPKRIVAGKRHRA